jgi:hypothetical protein
MLDFEVDELRSRADMLAQEVDHPAADIADMLEEIISMAMFSMTRRD